MSVSADFVTYVVDQLAATATVVSRRMFGGVGLYANGLFFGLIAEDTLYFKVDDSNRADYIRRGSKPFRPRAREPDTYSMNYFEVPADVIDDADELIVWARKALSVAAASAASKRAGSRPRRKPSVR
jgi:DNA transformation protein and related proteins